MYQTDSTSRGLKTSFKSGIAKKVTVAKGGGSVGREVESYTERLTQIMMWSMLYYNRPI